LEVHRTVSYSTNLASKRTSWSSHNPPRTRAAAIRSNPVTRARVPKAQNLVP